MILVMQMTLACMSRKYFMPADRLNDALPVAMVLTIHDGVSSPAICSQQVSDWSNEDNSWFLSSLFLQSRQHHTIIIFTFT